MSHDAMGRGFGWDGRPLQSRNKKGAVLASQRLTARSPLSYRGMLEDNSHNQNSTACGDVPLTGEQPQIMGPTTRRMITSTLKYV